MAWLITMIKKYRNGEINDPVKVTRQSRFNNFQGRDYDYAELERLENEQLKEYINRREEPEEEPFVKLDWEHLEQASLG